MERTTKTSKAIYYLRIAIAIIVGAVVIFFFLNRSEQMGTPLMDYFTTNFIEETGAQNAITGIYLHYRVYDTIFEALMLMVSVMEVLTVSSANRRAEEARQFQEDESHRKKNSEIIRQMTGSVFPVILLIGLFVIANGHVSPGGGFQGGSILVTGLISLYLVYPDIDPDLDLLERYEKMLFLGIIVTPVLYIFMQLQPGDSILSHQIYMILMNALIGFKVFLGLSIVFYHFVNFEGR